MDKISEKDFDTVVAEENRTRKYLLQIRDKQVKLSVEEKAALKAWRDAEHKASELTMDALKYGLTI